MLKKNTLFHCQYFIILKPISIKSWCSLNGLKENQTNVTENFSNIKARDKVYHKKSWEIKPGLLEQNIIINSNSIIAPVVNIWSYTLSSELEITRLIFCMYINLPYK